MLFSGLCLVSGRVVDPGSCEKNVAQWPKNTIFLYFLANPWVSLERWDSWTMIYCWAVKIVLHPKKSRHPNPNTSTEVGYDWTPKNISTKHEKKPQEVNMSRGTFLCFFLSSHPDFIGRKIPWQKWGDRNDLRDAGIIFGTEVGGHGSFGCVTTIGSF